MPNPLLSILMIPKVFCTRNSSQRIRKSLRNYDYNAWSTILKKTGNFSTIMHLRTTAPSFVNFGSKSIAIFKYPNLTPIQPAYDNWCSRNVKFHRKGFVSRIFPRFAVASVIKKSTKTEAKKIFLNVHYSLRILNTVYKTYFV